LLTLSKCGDLNKESLCFLLKIVDGIFGEERMVGLNAIANLRNS
jgi:hypothetical protein